MSRRVPLGVNKMELLRRIKQSRDIPVSVDNSEHEDFSRRRDIKNQPIAEAADRPEVNCAEVWKKIFVSD